MKTRRYYRNILAFVVCFGIVIWNQTSIGAQTVPSAYQNELSAVTSRFPGTRAQGDYSTCWAFSALGLCEFDFICEDERYDTTFNLSELQLAYATYHSGVDPLGGTKGDGYEITGKSDYLVCGGNLEYAVRTLMQWKGPVLEEELPYEGIEHAKDYPLKNYYEKAVAHLQNVYKIPILEDAEGVKEQIMEHGAVGISYYSPITVKEAVGYLGSAEYNGERVPVQYCDNRKMNANHAVNVVGWDDDFPAEAFVKTPPGNGAWLVRNSWSDANDYEEGSYFWLSYYDETIEDEAWVLDFEPADNYEHNYQYDGCILALDGSTVLDSLKFDAVANVFSGQASENEVLRAVSLSFMNRRDVPYTVKIYTDLSDIRNPRSGCLEEVVSGTTGYAGFYTIPLSKPVPIKKDTYYSVVVEFDSPSGVDMEFSFFSAMNHYKTTAAIEWGQSLAYKKGRWNDVWDAYRTYNLGNFCIKAYTDSVEGKNLKQVVKLAQKARTKHSITLSWRKVKDAEGYEIYRSLKSGGPYEKIKTVKTTDKLTFTDKGLKSGKAYYYRMRAIGTNSDGTKLVGKLSVSTKIKTK